MARTELQRTHFADRTAMQTTTDGRFPGMAVTVEIKTDRMILSYLPSPLLRYRQESLRSGKVVEPLSSTASQKLVIGVIPLACARHTLAHAVDGSPDPRSMTEIEADKDLLCRRIRRVDPRLK
jgi:hypothetical protein